MMTEMLFEKILKEYLLSYSVIYFHLIQHAHIHLITDIGRKLITFLIALNIINTKYDFG